MYINADRDKDISPQIEILDLDTGKFINHVKEAYENTENSISKSWYKQYQLNEDGSLTHCLTCDEIISQKIYANIKLVYKGK